MTPQFAAIAALAAWWPVQVGDSWVYAKQFLEGDMDHPSIETWTTEETVESVTAVGDSGAILVVKRVRVLDHKTPAGFAPGNDSTKAEKAESHLLIYRDAVYILDGAFAQGASCDNLGDRCLPPLAVNGGLDPRYLTDLLHGRVATDFRFPLTPGQTWGKVPSTSPAREYVWRVQSRNGDPFGPAGGETFHLVSYEGGGVTIDRWFTKGVGLVQ